MTITLPSPDTLREAAVEVARRLRDAGFEALWAGGCVRDALMGIAPKDYDIATDAHPEEVQRLFPRTVAVGAQFGVVVVLHGELSFEVATFRAEADYEDGRHPRSVRWANARADALRRDFTVNAMFFDPLAGELHDFVGGREDLAAKVVRAVGDPALRFAEDHLRVLRAIRFAARLDFEIHTDTWAALSAPGARLLGVSPERVHGELERILTEGRAARGLALLARSGLRAEALPELPAAAVSPAIERLRGQPPSSPARAWAILLYDIPERLEAIAHRLRWSRELREGVRERLAFARAVESWPRSSVSTRKRLLRAATSADGLLVAQAAVDAGQLSSDALQAVRADVACWSEDDLAPPPLLRGRDLTRAGYPPGPWFGRALAALEDAQLEGEARDVGDAWAIVRRFAPVDHRGGGNGGPGQPSENR